MQVLNYYETLLKEKSRANEVLCTPRREATTKEAKQAQEESRARAKVIKARNLQRLCAEKYPLTVQKSQVCKWYATAKTECWRDLPEMLRARVSATNNAWRLRLGLKAKGRQQGGEYPLELQRELDVLIYEHANGMSDVSERKEVVTLEHVAARFETM